MSDHTITQREAILRFLMTGGEIDAQHALKAFGCFRLAARIDDLRRQGYRVESRMVHNKITGKRYAVYTLPEPRQEGLFAAS
jgi:hypothetical protein